MDAPLPLIDMEAAPDRCQTFPQHAGMDSVRHPVRDVAVRRDGAHRITRHTVESGKAESVHHHSAYAYLERIRSVPN